MTTSNLVVPMVLWGQNAPTHCVASIMMSPDQQHVITGCNDGQICVWEVKENWKVIVQFVAMNEKQQYSTMVVVEHTFLSLILSSCVIVLSNWKTCL